MASPPPQDDNDDIMTERTCHILPCNIEESLMAPTHIYFRPVAADGYSSTFRGRGLTAQGKTSANLALLSHTSSNGQKIAVKASIDNILEWHHEHDVGAIRIQDQSSSRVHVAKEWSELAEALHDPIPVES